MQSIRDELRNQYRNRAEMELAVDYSNRCEPRLVPILTEILSDAARTDSLIANCQDDQIDSDERIQNIRDMLKNGQFTDVAEYIIRLDAQVGHHDEWKSLEVKEQVLYFVMLLKSYLFDDLVSKHVHLSISVWNSNSDSNSFFLFRNMRLKSKRLLLHFYKMRSHFPKP